MHRGDYDNDGAIDLAVTAADRLLLLHNEKDGSFKDVTEAVGIVNPKVKTSELNLGLTFVDYDHDGDLDLYVTRFINVAAPVAGRAIALPSDQLFSGNVMWRNNGNGSFTDVTSQSDSRRTPRAWAPWGRTITTIGQSTWW